MLVPSENKAPLNVHLAACTHTHFHSPISAHFSKSQYEEEGMFFAKISFVSQGSREDSGSPQMSEETLVYSARTSLHVLKQF